MKFYIKHVFEIYQDIFVCKEIVLSCFLLYIFILISCSYLLPILDLYNALQLAILCMVID